MIRRLWCLIVGSPPDECGPYDEGKDELVQAMYRQADKADREREAIRRRRATGNWFGDGLGDRDGRRRYEAEGGRG